MRTRTNVTHKGKGERYQLCTGSVQCYVSGFTGGKLTHHFGMAEYDRNLPILTDSKRSRATPIVDALNAGTLTEEQARKELDKIRW